jgi:hypothetical protein
MVPKHKKAITSFTVVSCRCCGNLGAERLGEWTEEEGQGDESPKKVSMSIRSSNLPASITIHTPAQ